MRDMQTEIDERMMRIRQIVHQRSKENQALKRKALVKGKLAVEALLDNKSAENFEQERRLQMEMEALLGDRETLRKTAATAELLLSAGFPDVIKACSEKYAFMQELREDDYEMITTDIDDLHFRAVQWHEFRSKSGGGSSARRGETGDGIEGWGARVHPEPRRGIYGEWQRRRWMRRRRPRPWGINCSSGTGKRRAGNIIL